MSQGKAYTPEQKEMIINSLQEYLELGYSRNKACGLIGLQPQTLSLWLSDDEALLMKIKGWENFMSALVLRNIRNVIIKEQVDEKSDTSKWYAERKLKNDGFSTKTETDITSNGEQIQPLLVKFIDNAKDSGDTNRI